MSDVADRRRRTAAVAMLVFAAIGLALVPAKAEGRSSAYVAFGVGFVLSAVVAAVVERRTHQSRKDPPLALIPLVGVGLIVTSLGVPVLETTALGVLSGAAVGAASMILLEAGGG